MDWVWFSHHPTGSINRKEGDHKYGQNSIRIWFSHIVCNIASIKTSTIAPLALIFPHLILPTTENIQLKIYNCEWRQIYFCTDIFAYTLGGMAGTTSKRNGTRWIGKRKPEATEKSALNGRNLSQNSRWVWHKCNGKSENHGVFVIMVIALVISPAILRCNNFIDKLPFTTWLIAHVTFRDVYCGVQLVVPTHILQGYSFSTGTSMR